MRRDGRPARALGTMVDPTPGAASDAVSGTSGMVLAKTSARTAAKMAAETSTRTSVKTSTNTSTKTSTKTSAEKPAKIAAETSANTSANTLARMSFVASGQLSGAAWSVARGTRGVAASLALALMLAACGGDAPSSGGATETLAPRAWLETLAVDGEIKAAASTALNVPGSNWSQRVLVDMVADGSSVEKGQVVARFDSPQSRMELSQAELELLRKTLAEQTSASAAGVERDKLAGERAGRRRRARPRRKRCCTRSATAWRAAPPSSATAWPRWNWWRRTTACSC